jgi:excinuclease ABC subunit C
VKGLFRREAFTGFGPCSLAGHEPTLFGGHGRARRLRGLVRREVPRAPGVYGMVDVNGTLIYVGKARSLRSRLMSYFVPSRDDKAAHIIREARRIVWEPGPNELAALLREMELIRRWQPRWNVAGQPRRQRRVYLCLGRKPAPYAFVTGKVPSTARVCYGPFPGARRTREACDRLNDWFRLRDCPRKQVMRFADQNELFPMAYTPGCLRHEIGNCLAPCAAACSQPDYAFHVAAARDFLEGRDRTPLEQLTRQMQEAATELRFEQAAVLRDRLGRLEWLWRHLERLREARTISGLYPVDNHDGSQTWYVLRHGVIRRALPVPADADAQARLREQVRALLTAGPRDPGPPGLGEIDGVLVVCGWFRRRQGEREKIIDEP